MQFLVLALPEDKFMLVIGGIESIVHEDGQAIVELDALAGRLREETGACSVILTEEDIEVLPGKYKLTPAHERKVMRLVKAQLEQVKQ